MSDETRESELRALEAGLQALAPRAPAIDRDRLLFLAGRASARRQVAGWRAWAVGSTLAAAGLAAVLVLRPVSQREVVAIRWLPAPAEQQSSPAESGAVTAESSSLNSELRAEPYAQVQLRRLAFSHGIDALPHTFSPESDEHAPTLTDEPPSAGSRIWWQMSHP